MTQPTISVVQITYNRLATLIPVLESIVAQTHPAQEIIIVDDGSTDETPVRLPQLIAERPGWSDRVQYIWQENQGQSAALNRGIAEATGEWIAFASHDDLWLPWKLEWQMESLKQHGSEFGLCCTDAWFMNNPHMKLNLWAQYGAESHAAVGELADPLKMMVESRYLVWVQTVIARAELVRRAGGFDVLLRYLEDQDFVFRMALLTRFCYVSMPMVLIDRSPSEIRHVGTSLDWHRVDFCLGMDQRRLETQLRLSEGKPERIRKAIRRNLAANHSHWANFFLGQGDFGKAKAAMEVAVGHDRSAKLALKRVLVTVAPRMARRLFEMRERKAGPRYDRTGWRSEPAASKAGG